MLRVVWGIERFILKWGDVSGENGQNVSFLFSEGGGGGGVGILRWRNKESGVRRN